MKGRYSYLVVLIVLVVLLPDSRLGSLLYTTGVNTQQSRQDQVEVLDAIRWLRDNRTVPEIIGFSQLGMTVTSAPSSGKTYFTPTSLGLGDYRPLSIASLYGFQVKPTVSYPDYILSVKTPIGGLNQTWFFIMMGYQPVYQNHFVAVLEKVK